MSGNEEVRCYFSMSEISVFNLISDPPEYLSFSPYPTFAYKKGSGYIPTLKFRRLIIYEIFMGYELAFTHADSPTLLYAWTRK
jgi:hypothetical protein